SMRSALTVIKEQINNFYLIRRLSLYEIKSKNKNNYFGAAWEFINPGIQLLIYWFVFGTIRDRAPVEVNGVETPFFTWLLAGFFMWTFCHQSILKGSNSIYTRLRMLSKMNFPMSVIPNYVIFITSTLSTIARDFHMVLSSTIRMLLYLSGVLWPLSRLEDFPFLIKIMMLNPIYYLIQGYRSAFFGTDWYFITHWQYSLYFWGLIIVLFLICSTLHVSL